MEPRIALISPYTEMTALAREVIASLAEPVILLEGALHKSGEQVRELEAAGVDAIITSAGNSVFLREQTVLPVIPIPSNSFDLLHTVYRVLRQGYEPVALFHYREVNPRVQEVEEVLAVRLQHWVFTSEEDGVEKLRQAAPGLGAVVGGGYICQVARSMGLPAFPIRLSREAILQAIQTAREVSLVRRKERAETMRLQAIVDFAHEGIIATDAEGRITVFNSIAEQTFGLKAADVIGRRAQEVLPSARLDVVARTGVAELGELMQAGPVQVVTNRVPILDENRVVGVVANFQDVRQIRRLEQKIRAENYLKGHVARFTFADIAGESRAIKRALQYARRFGASDETVLITGESGSGKELFAQSMHNISRRAGRPFLAINCAAIPSSLLESELFGYAEGAFTGAKKGGKMGLFELAHRGTVFLDEVGELPGDLQARLLRVLQERTVMRIGDDRLIPVDVRIIAATNRDLEEAVRQGVFRKDLYYRLNVLHLKVPPLRERREDIPVLAENILARLGAGELALRKHILAALERLREYDWPGNVRELENLLRRLVVLLQDAPDAERAEIAAELAAEVAASGGGNTAQGGEQIAVELKGSLRDILDDVERQVLERLARSGQDRTELARRLGIGRTTLWRKLNDFGLQ